jgi:anti-sigma regulatory factor (Ser/Thr protein kinase)
VSPGGRSAEAAGLAPATACDGPGVTTLELPSEACMASVARATVRALLQGAGDVRLDEREIDEVALVVHEACTNVVRHAHGHDASKRFRVEVARRGGEIEIRVVDEGRPFDLAEAPREEPEELREGGYGIHIMRAWMDEVDVRHDGRGNVLRLVRRYRIAAAAEGGAVADRA